MAVIKGSSTAEVDAPIDRCWALIEDVATAPRLSWRQLEGDLHSMEGEWELEDLGGGRTRVTYSVAVDPGSVGRLARGPIERAARAILVNPRPRGAW